MATLTELDDVSGFEALKFEANRCYKIVCVSNIYWIYIRTTGNNSHNGFIAVANEDKGKKSYASLSGDIGWFATSCWSGIEITEEEFKRVWSIEYPNWVKEAL